MQRLWRQAAWGCAAAAALLVAVVCGRSDVGTQRAAQALAALNAQGGQTATGQFDPEAATRQLVAAVRGLGEDRDRIARRLATVEREMNDMTGSIKQQVEAAKDGTKTASTKAPAPWPIDAPPVPMTPADVAAMVKSLRPATNRLAAADASSYSPPPYGADIGNAASVKALQLRWTGLHTAHPQLFDGLQPLVSLRENPRTNRSELHLVVGPYSNADAAAQLCSALGAFHVSCQPTMFDGSRLALQ